MGPPAQGPSLIVVVPEDVQDRSRQVRLGESVAQHAQLLFLASVERIVIMASSCTDWMARNVKAIADKLFLENVDGARVKNTESIVLEETCIPSSWHVPLLAVPGVAVFDDTHTRRGVDMLGKGITPNGDACLVCAGM